MDSSQQHPTGSPHGPRVYELAKELGVSSKTVLTTLKEIGAFRPSAASVVDPPTATRLRHAVHQALRSGHATPAGSHPPSPDTEIPPPLTGLAKTLRGTFLQLQTDEEASKLADAWTADLFTDHDVIAWCRAGLTPRDHVQARQLRAHGISPQHLGLAIEGKSIKSLLRGGWSVTRIVGLLRQHGHLAR